MEIKLNGQTLDFTLEKESNIDEVIKAVEEWLSKSELVLVSAILNGQEILTGPSESWKRMPLRQDDKFHLTVKNAHDARLINLQTVLEYLSMLEAALSSQDEKLLQELFPGFPYMVESVEKSIPLALKQELQQLKNIFSLATPAKVCQQSEETVASTNQLISAIAKTVRGKVEQWSNPKQTLKEIIAELTPCIDKLGEISVLLQTGRDRQAMETIIHLSDLLQSLIGVFVVLRDQASGDSQLASLSSELDALYPELNRVLKDIIKAFQMQDSVLIGDLMEYEVAPRLENLKDFAIKIA